VPERPTTPAEVVAFQATACGIVGSRLYEQILTGVLDDLRAGGVSARLLDDRDGDPFGSALALRLLGAVHRIVLDGRAPELAAHYPSAGGDPTIGDPVAPFLAVLEAHEAELAQRITDGVQTNEVGRSAALVGGYAEVVRRAGLPLRVLEIGASAGLNLRFDHYAYDTGEQLCGDPDSPVRFAGVWEGTPPELPRAFDVAERRGCDRNPIDATTEEGQLTLLAYVWPDQVDRLDRLAAALEVAARVPVAVEQADAATWVEAALAERRPGTATVVVHSIVLQYLGPERRRRFRDLVAGAGARATAAAPLAWLRMEPATEDAAEVRLTLWPGGEDRALGLAGYHGMPVRWGEGAPDRLRYSAPG
jgi:hypothetical protein